MYQETAQPHFYKNKNIQQLNKIKKYETKKKCLRYIIGNID